MTEVRVSPKYQVVIPREVREKVLIKSGQKVTMVAKQGVVFIVPHVSVKKLKGTLKGISATGFREKKDRI